MPPHPSRPRKRARQRSTPRGARRTSPGRDQEKRSEIVRLPAPKAGAGCLQRNEDTARAGRAHHGPGVAADAPSATVPTTAERNGPKHSHHTDGGNLDRMRRRGIAGPGQGPSLRGASLAGSLRFDGPCGLAGPAAPEDRWASEARRACPAPVARKAGRTSSRTHR